MRHDLGTEMKHSMDALHFSPEEKQQLTAALIQAYKEQNMKQKHTPRRLMLVALAAALVLVTLTGAAVFTRMSRSISADYRMTEDQKQAAEKSGLSVMLEETQTAEESPSLISATDNGITITAVQTLVDKYRARLVFRIEGFDLPEGEYPSVEGGVVSVAGKEYPTPIGGWINNGLLTDPLTETATYQDGSPLEYDEEGATILRPLARDGSFEYCLELQFPTETHSGLGVEGLNYMEHLGSEIVVKFTNIGIEDYLDHVPMVEGDWTLKWTLTGTEDTLFVEPHAPIGTSGFTLLNAEITPISCILTMEGDAYSHKSPYVDEYFYWIPHLAGVVLKDDTIIPCPGYGGGGFGEIATNIHSLNTTIQAVELDEIQALAFGNMETENGRPYYIVPIR